MINLFNFASDDQSLVYLQGIFGSMNGIIPVPPDQLGTLSSGVSISLLGTMFNTFNTIVLAVGALIVIYITIVGVLRTAAEGEFLGKNWNSLWVPLRVVFGIAALVPTGSGYSGLQILMMWVIVQGIGAADTLWGTVLGFVNVAGSPYAQVTIPSVDVNQGLRALFQGMTCDATAKMSASYSGSGKYYCDPTQHSGGFCDGSPYTPFAASVCTTPFGLSNSTPNCTYLMGPNGACGKLVYS